ncbi:MAG: hypothetical protein IJM28_06020, partial [Lachnospiraceae bacterium]|nr:hypothetical protein [Lachnospiraceae bacterium]
MYVDNGELKFKHNLIKRTKGVTSIFLSFVLLISLVLTSVPAIEALADPEAHEHNNWSYLANGVTITATCNEEGCAYSGENGVVLTLSASDAAYTGSPYAGATLDSTAWVAAGLVAPTISYEGRGETVYESTSTAPVTPGT